MQKDYSVLRGPCPEGFHIPLSSEWATLCTILSSTFSMAQNRITAGTYLKMPTAGYRIKGTAEVNNVGNRGDYWSTTPRGDSIYILTFTASSLTPQNMDSRSSGISIRGFKDTPVIPTSSWTTLYDGSSVAANAGIFHNATDGLISISGDGVTWYTIQDKNLGATTVYNYGDTLTDANCGYFYQRGNNYGFPHSGNVTKSTIKPDASTYGPVNYYSSNKFIKITSTASSQSDWSSVKNNNLWGYESFLSQDNDIYVCEGAGENYYYQWGPCSDGFHVPSATELQGLVSIMNSMNIRDGYDFAVKLHLPPMGYRLRDGSISRGGTIGLYRSVTPYENIPDEVIILRAQFSLDAEARGAGARNGALPVRGFSNEYVQPQSNWTVIHGTLGSAGIFWDQTNGFISVTDGTNGYTISDKNCGATTVYNYGNTMSENNCGCYYQRGNNYGFPFDGTIPNISPSKVDTTWNGPSNPYYSSTYINTSDSNWSTTNNNDLRGYKYVEKYDHLEIYVGDGIPKSSFRGPCPYGFHVPTGNEWRIVTNIMNHLFPKNEYYISIHPDYYKQYLHMPIPGDLGGGGQRSGDDRSIEYWASTPSDSHGYAETIYLNNLNGENSNVYVGGYYRGRGFPIRPFKDDAIALDYSFNTYIRDLVKEEGSFRLYENTRDGFLSLTDGERWITMADKNLGATAVYNPGDTLTQDNCGGFFQRGNNYMFPFSGATTTSASQVDATGYGPLNPYSSNTFVKIYNNRTDWANPANDNLWGGTTQLIQNVAEVYKGTTLVWTNYQPTTPTAGIYWCPTKKCISISANGTDWITMSDRNIGAAKPGDVGLLYQRGNNYGFPPQRLTTVSTDSTQIDVSSYGPNNYYYSDTYITNNFWRSNGDVRDLRGGVTFTDESVRGPCGEGWHIPSRGDLQHSINWAKQIISDYDTIRNVLKLGEGRYRDRAGASKCCYYAVRCCEATYYSSSQKTYPYFLRASGEHTSPVIDISQTMTNYAHPIRPFKNEPVVPNDTSRIKLT